ncbi:MAG: spore coat protein CotJB [Eubacteriales bacterium]|nr:spore coat protein CotJB [Eubacteriales bacterium]
MTEQQKALQDIRQHKFAVIDAGMYLDGHPEDETALQYFRMMAKKQQQAEETYQKHFGPLQLVDAGTEKRWDWIDEPWPWEV